MQKVTRRRAPRKDFGGLANVLIGGQITTCPCLQIGEGGALLDIPSNTMAEVGKTVVVHFFLPNVGGIVASALCVYLTPEGKMGLQFADLELRFKIRIRDFVSRRKQAFSVGLPQ